MSEQNNDQLIDAALQRLLRQIRRTQWLRAVLMLGTIALAGLLVMMAIDWFFAPLPLWSRWSMFAAWLGLLAFVAKKGWAPVFRQIGLVQLARWVEWRHPEMQERISTALELRGQPEGVSSQLLEELRHAAVTDAAAVDARGEVKSVSTNYRWWRPAVALLAVLAALLIVWPKQSVRLLVRAVAPFSQLGNAGASSFVIRPGSIELLEGDALQIEVDYQGDATTMEIVSKWENGESSSEALQAKGSGSFVYTIDPVARSFRYHMRAGRAESDAYQVTVWPLPSLVDPTIAIDAPKYLGLTRAEQPLSDQVSAVVGSQFVISTRTNTAVESARLEIEGKTIATATVTAVSGVSELEFSWSMETAGLSEATIFLKHRLGREVEAHRFAIEMVDDLAPKVILLSPVQKELRLRADELLDLRYEVTEDFSLARVAVELNDHGDKMISLGQNLPFRIDGSKPPRYRGNAELSIGDLMTRMGNKRDFRIRLRAQDGKPAERNGPGVGYSEWVRIRIDENAESLVRQELREQHEGAMQQMDKTIQQVREARERMDWHKEEIKKGEISENAEKNLTEAAEKLAEAQEKTNELAAQMEESVHATLADEMKKAAETMQQSREDMENAPLQDEAAQREEKLSQARNQAEDSIKQLEAIKQEMQKQNEKIQDLARMQELAQKQQELARQAQQQAQQSQNSDKPEEAKTPQDWQQQQEQVAQQIRQEMQEQPQALEEALRQQAEQAKELAERAQEMAKSQEQLQQQAQQAAENQNQLSEESQKQLQQALAKEQENIAAETAEQLAQAQEQRSELANDLPKAAESTEQASEAMKQDQQPQQAAESAKAAEQALAEAAEQADAQAQEADKVAQEAANPEVAQEQKSEAAQNPQQAAEQAQQAAEAASELQQLAERQEQVAEAMQALAEGDEAKALQALQEAQAQQAQELAQAIDSLPQVQQSGAMQQAEQSGKQAGEQAQQASQQAQQGQQQQASQQHQQSQQNFEKSAQALQQAAAELAQAAEQASQRQSSPQQAQASPEALAEAFQQASQAATSPSQQQAAEQAQQAAQAMQQAAQSAKSQMQGHQPASPGMAQQGQETPGEPGQQPGMQSQQGDAPAEPDPGVPPELAKLGISADDWEKIQASLASDVGAGSSSGIPEEYRELVKGYFQSMSAKDNPKR